MKLSFALLLIAFVSCSGNSGGSGSSKITVNSLKGKNFSTDCLDINGSIFAKIALSFSNSLIATSTLTIYTANNCSSASKVATQNTSFQIEDATEGLDNLPKGAIGIDGTRISTFWTAHSADTASAWEAEDCSGDGIDFSGNLNVAQEVSGKCDEKAIGSIEYGMLKYLTSTKPATLYFGTDKEGNPNDGSTPDLRYDEYIAIGSEGPLAIPEI